MHQLVLYFLGIVFAWGLMELLLRRGFMKSMNAALMLSLSAMMGIVRIVDWEMNSPVVNARTGKQITAEDFFFISGGWFYFALLLRYCLRSGKGQSHRCGLGRKSCIVCGNAKSTRDAGFLKSRRKRVFRDSVSPAASQAYG